ncbi:MAG: hypothetical protein KGM98_08000 [Bacteroidota bacterium]|nr:hypothetical protein [Bacteroidota bacterium]
MTLLTNMLVFILFVIVMGSSVILLQIINHKEQSPKEVMDGIKKKLHLTRTRIFLVILLLVLAGAFLVYLNY